MSDAKSFKSEAFVRDFCCKKIFCIQLDTKTQIETIRIIEIVIQTINSISEKALFILFLESIYQLYI